MKRRRGMGAAVIAALAILGAGYALAGRPWHLRWGATEEEAQESVTGDVLIPAPDLVATRAITIHAPAVEIWPWIVQLGQGRGGFYSYDCLENLIGCDIHSADRIVPEWQTLDIDDEVRLYPGGGLRVAVVEPSRALVLRGGVPLENTLPYDFTWAFVLREQPDGTTRLLVRERYSYGKWWAALVVEPVEAISFVMSRKMLRGIRDRAAVDRTDAQGEGFISR